MPSRHHPNTPLSSKKEKRTIASCSAITRYAALKVKAHPSREIKVSLLFALEVAGGYVSDHVAGETSICSKELHSKIEHQKAVIMFFTL